MLRVAFVCACGALWLVAARIMTCCPGCACQKRAGPDVADVEISMRHPALSVLRRAFFGGFCLFRVDQTLFASRSRKVASNIPAPAPRCRAIVARERYAVFDHRDAVGTYAPRCAATRSRRRRRSPTTVRGPYRYRKTEPDRTTVEISGGFGSVRLFGWTSPGFFSLKLCPPVDLSAFDD